MHIHTLKKPKVEMSSKINQQVRKMSLLISNLTSYFRGSKFFPQTYFKISFISSSVLKQLGNRDNVRTRITSQTRGSTWFAYVKYLRKLGKNGESLRPEIMKNATRLPAQYSRSWNAYYLPSRDESLLSQVNFNCGLYLCRIKYNIINKLFYTVNFAFTKLF